MQPRLLRSSPRDGWATAQLPSALSTPPGLACASSSSRPLQQQHHHLHQQHASFSALQPDPHQQHPHGRRLLLPPPAAAGRRKGAAGGGRVVRQPLLVTLQPDGSDVWRLEPVIEALANGGIGIIPTDSLPAVVADLDNRDASLSLFSALELHPKKQLSILVGGFADIATYTAGFPIPTQPGQPDWFGLARRVLPGPYTFILPASKRLPAQVVDFRRGRTAKRKSVGVRWPAEPACQALLSGLGRCLLSHSVHVPGSEPGSGEYEVPDAGMLSDLYASRGLDFIVDVAGARRAVPTSVIDMTSGEPVVVRVGRGDVSLFEAAPV